MKYFLILIILQGGNIHTLNAGIFETMFECFDERDSVVEMMKRPIINYQAVCVIQSDEKFEPR